MALHMPRWYSLLLKWQKNTPSQDKPVSQLRDDRTTPILADFSPLVLSHKALHLRTLVLVSFVTFVANRPLNVSAPSTVSQQSAISMRRKLFNEKAITYSQMARESLSMRKGCSLLLINSKLILHPP